MNQDIFLRLQLASDLHLDRLERNDSSSRLVIPAKGADILILAGDIHNGTQAIATFADWPTPVYYLAGNHEFYGMSWEQTRVDLRKVSAGTNVTYLDNDLVQLDGVRLLGCTLWTDFLLSGFTRDEWMREIDASLNDRIVHTHNGPLRSMQTLEDHMASRDWLERELAKPFSGKTIVASHHGPHPLSINPRYAGHRLNAGFASDLTMLLRNVDLWVHGHVHDSVDYRIGRCRVVANPAGFALNRKRSANATNVEFENSSFEPQFFLDI